MTIVSSNLHWEGWVHTQTDKKSSYVVIYTVLTDNPLDGPLYIRQNYGGPQIGDTYSVENENDPLAKCNSVVPSRQGTSRIQWWVTSTFETPSQDEEDDQQPDDQGNLTKDPLQWAPTVSTSTVNYSVAVMRAKLIGLGFADGPDPAFGMPHLSRAPGSIGPVINSAGTVLNPPLEKSEKIVVYRITKNFRIAPDHEKFVDSVNADEFILAFQTPLLARQFKPRTMLMEAFSLTPQRTNGVDYWQGVYELHHRKKTWVRGTPDIGYAAVADDGSSDATDDAGLGGQVAIAPDGSVVSDPTPSEDIAAGTSVPRTVTDDRGYPSSEPVELDGHGHVLKPTAETLYLYYLAEDEINFAGLQMDKPDA